MIYWRDASSWYRGEDRSEPKLWEAKIGMFTLRVHRHIHYPPDMWLASCHPDLFSQLELASKDAELAKREAVDRLRACCKSALNEMDEEPKET